jgi:6-phosphogluconolactonase
VTPPRPLALVACQGGDHAPGIVACALDVRRGRLEPLAETRSVRDPLFVAAGESPGRLYAACDVDRREDAPTGRAYALALDPSTGDLSCLDEASTGGTTPCHLSPTPDGRFLLVSNFRGPDDVGSGCVLPLEPDGTFTAREPTGTIAHAGSSVHPTRQRCSHVHSITPAPDGRLVHVADLGVDRLAAYRLTAAGQAIPAPEADVSTRPGSGPRHLAFTPDGRLALLVHEMDNSVSALLSGPDGELRETCTLSTLPDGVEHSACADVRVHSSGRFAYASNRGHDSIAIFAVDPATGRLEARGHAPTHGRTPRSFAIDPTGSVMVVANQGSDELVCFRVDLDNGTLSPIGDPLPCPGPICVQIVQT